MVEQSEAQMLAEIGASLARGDFVPVFQPILTLPSRDVLGFEALARWRKSDGALHPPAAFAPALDDPVLESRISEAIAFKSVDAAAELKARGLAFGCIAVNFSEEQLSDGPYADRLLAMFAERGLEPRNFSAEIRETVKLGEEEPRRYDALKRLSAAGAIVAIDDFGAGFASMQSLLSPFVKRVKIDLSMTRAAMRDLRARKLLAHCVKIGEELEFEVVVEGVENAACEKMLLEIGCKAAQGYFYARPAPLAEVIKRLEAGGYA